MQQATTEQALAIIKMIGLEPDKEGYYQTDWGKKTLDGLIESVKNATEDKEEPIYYRLTYMINCEDKQFMLSPVYPENYELADGANEYPKFMFDTLLEMNAFLAKEKHILINRVVFNQTTVKPLEPDSKNYLGEEYLITSVCREDLKGIGYQTADIKPEVMKRLASKLSDAYCESSFWIDLPIIADSLEIPKKEQVKA